MERARTFERVVFADLWRSDSGRLRAARALKAGRRPVAGGVLWR